MNLIRNKRERLNALFSKDHIVPKRVEIVVPQNSLVFTFNADGQSPEAVHIQQELMDIFDFTKDIAVVLEKNEKQIVNKHVDLADMATENKAEDKEYRDDNLKQRLREISEAVKKQDAIKTVKTTAEEEAEITEVGAIIYGKKLKGESITLSDIDFSKGYETEEAEIVVTGRVFDVEAREINDKTTLYKYNITDNTSSISCKIFANTKKNGDLKVNLTDDRTFKIAGKLNFDDYSKEVVLDTKYMEVAKPKIRTDTASVKRVELHLHTQYSAMDAVSKTKKIMKQAADFGHDTIGITDHGVLQAYPEMMSLGEKYGIKVLYGVEGYLIDDDFKIVKGSADEVFDGEFIVFDLETTGLTPGVDKIIEIGAVKVKNGQITDHYSQLVNPQQLISDEIMSLTSLTNDMLQNEGIDEEDAVKAFVDFCGDRVLVAHNADFDMSFLNRALEKWLPERLFTALDTMAFSQTLLTNIKRHNLKRLASYFKIDMGHHHRALDDSICTAKVFIRLLDLAAKKGAHRVTDINGLIDMDNIIHSVRPYHIIIYAKNQDGLRDLYELVSEAHIHYFHKRPLMPRSLIEQFRENLIIGSACESGELYKAVLNNTEDEKLVAIAKFYDYLEVQPLGNNEFLIRDSKVSAVESMADLIHINQKIISLGKQEGIPVVATGDVHFVDKEDAYFREILQAGQKYADANLQPPLFYRSTKEMMDEFAYLDKKTAHEIVVENTRKIAEMIGDVKPIPDGTFPPIIEGSDEEIREKVYSQAYKIYGNPLPDIVEARIDKELTSIIGNGYSVLYLIAQKLVEKSEGDGYLVGSRGSVGSSLVAMLCGITEVNSLAPHYICPECKHYEFFDSTKVGVGPDLPDANCPRCGHKLDKDGFDIPFETFLGFEGDKEPDIDLNFSGDYQPEAHHYTEVLFGEGKVFRAGTIATLADKTAFGYVKNYMEEKGIRSSKAEMVRVIDGCAGIKRTTGQHPGGIMVVPDYKDIYEFTPIQKPADDVNTDTLTTHFDYHSISGRLLKLDILGHDDPTMLRMLQDLTGVNPREIPLDDEKVISLFTSTEALGIDDDDFDIPIGTCGIPEFGTNFVREMVLDTKPTAFSDLIRISGLSHGTDVWLNNAQNLIRSKIASIKEVICTRDDIMLVLISYRLDSKSAFTIMEKVRKGKGLTADQEDLMRQKKVPEWYIDSCKKIKYMFPKAHAAAYVTMAFRIAYYKVYYPLAYYATYFSVRAKEFDLAKMIRGKTELKKAMDEIKSQGTQASTKDQQLLTSLEIALEMYCRGYSFKNVSLYKSHYSDFTIEEDKLRPPLNAIDGLGDKAARLIYDEARKGEFISKEDLVKRAKVNKTNLESLTQLGCLFDLPESDQVSFIAL